MIPKIKICGISQPDTVEALNRLRPDYAGFVFAESSRQVTPESARELTAKLISSVRRVGVFVNADEKFILKAADMCGLNVIQLHGGEDAAFTRRLRELTGCEIWKTVRVKDGSSLMQIRDYPADRFLTDAYLASAYGGGGKVFNWDLLKDIDTSKIILAGGLNISNITRAIQRVHPFAVDLSSGVETDGKKDARKIGELIQTVRGGNI